MTVRWRVARWQAASCDLLSSEPRQWRISTRDRIASAACVEKAFTRPETLFGYYLNGNKFCNLSRRLKSRVSL